MKNVKCKLGLHDWRYLNGITRQCVECGKLQYRKSWFWLWKWMNTDNRFQRGAKVILNEKTEIVTIKKGTIVLECNGFMILNDYTRVPSYLAKKVKEDIFIYPSYEYHQKIKESEGER